MVEIDIILSSGWIVLAPKAVRDMNQMRMSERKKNWEEVFILKLLTRKREVQVYMSIIYR